MSWSNENGEPSHGVSRIGSSGESHEYQSDQNKILWPEALGASNNPAIVQKILKAQNQFSFLTFQYVKSAHICACFRVQWSRWVIHEDWWNLFRPWLVVMVLQACSFHMPQTQLHSWPASIRSTISLVCLHLARSVEIWNFTQRYIWLQDYWLGHRLISREVTDIV
jgi:hypothetical protein